MPFHGLFLVFWCLNLVARGELWRGTLLRGRRAGARERAGPETGSLDVRALSGLVEKDAERGGFSAATTLGGRVSLFRPG